MTTEEEVAYLRQRVSELEGKLATEQRRHQTTKDFLEAARSQVVSLEGEIRALRADQKPSMHREEEFPPHEVGPTTDRQQRHA